MAALYVKRVEVVEREEVPVVNSLMEVATSKHHARYHVPDQAGEHADHVMAWIKVAIDRDPTAPVACWCVLKFIFCNLSSLTSFSIT